MVFGTFDILHLGHIDLFLQAKKLGDRLLVVCATDANTEKVKGHAPIHSENDRAQLLRYIDIIDEVIVGDEHNVYKVIAENMPQVIALGYDQESFVDKLQQYIDDLGVAIEIVRLKPHKSDVHKSALIKSYIVSNI